MSVKLKSPPEKKHNVVLKSTLASNITSVVEILLRNNTKKLDLSDNNNIINMTFLLASSKTKPCV